MPAKKIKNVEEDTEKLALNAQLLRIDGHITELMKNPTGYNMEIIRQLQNDKLQLQYRYEQMKRLYVDKQTAYRIEYKTNAFIYNCLPAVFHISMAFNHYIDAYFHKTYGAMKKTLFADIEKKYRDSAQRIVMYFHDDYIAKVICITRVNINDSSNRIITCNNNDIKLIDLGEPELRFDVRGPSNRTIVLKVNENYFIFDSEINTIDALKFIKKKISINYKTLSYKDNIIEETAKLIDAFTPHHIVHELSTIRVKQIKTNDDDIEIEHFGAIYLIRTREFAGKNIFKIGKTENNISNRLGNYGKGGEVLFTIAGKINSINGYEQELISIFMSKFNQQTDIGTEYFEGDYREMIQIIYEYMMSKLN